VTARADLLNLMAEWGLTTGKGSRDIADRILGAHAHELATEQRTVMRAPGRSYDASRWNRCVNMTADAIDPEAS
jgi:hypothetical protein